MSRLNRPIPLVILAFSVLVGTLIPRSIAAKDLARAETSRASKNVAVNSDPTSLLNSDPNHLSAVEALKRIRREEEESIEGNGFTYRPGDRRDPFMSPQDILKANMSGRICEGEGMECWFIQDVTIIGVLQKGTGAVALVIGPDGYGTTLHEGDILYDGQVRRIDSRGGSVVFRQKIDDPTRIKPFRDVHKGLNLKKEGRS